jgi:hypothetical protein
LQLENCPKLTGGINPNCIAASLMLHLTKDSSAYLENVWIWTADHDIDKLNQDQIDIYSARGLLIESKGPTWLWGTSVEHCVLYQYQFSGAKNILVGLIQTESPYFQTVPAAPSPFTLGTLPDDPTFSNCAPGSDSCAMSWGVRLVDSSTIYILSTGLYTWFQNYDRTCMDTGANDCQDKVFYTEQSYDVYIYNLVTIGNVEMISPLNGAATIAASNRNGFASSILAWLGGVGQTTGEREFVGYQVYEPLALDSTNFPLSCKTALTATVKCDSVTAGFREPSYHGILENSTITNSVCDPGCKKSLEEWMAAVDVLCDGYTWSNGAPPEILGAYIQYGVKETCQKAANGAYCNGT